jgi:hypothetical protein
MLRNLATLLLYIGVLFFNVQMPPILLLLYTLCILLGDGYAYYPKKIQKIVFPIWFFFENLGPVGYNIEFVPIILLSGFIFIKTLLRYYI